MLNASMSPAEALQVKSLIEVLLRNSASSTTGGDAVEAMRDWRHYLQGQPIGALVLAVDEQVRSAERRDDFMPTIGRFMSRVARHITDIEIKRNNLRDALEQVR